MSKSLTRRHYVAIATAIKNTSMPHDTKLTLVRSLCDELEKFNTSFNSDMFMSACFADNHN